MVVSMPLWAVMIAVIVVFNAGFMLGLFWSAARIRENILRMIRDEMTKTNPALYKMLRGG